MNNHSIEISLIYSLSISLPVLVKLLVTYNSSGKEIKTYIFFRPNQPAKFANRNDYHMRTLFINL